MKPRRTGERLTILDLLLMVAGVALGLWLILGLGPQEPVHQQFVAYFIFFLGGLSIVGPPILIRRRLLDRCRRRLGPGEFFWFCQGTATWLLWPPIVVNRVGIPGSNRSMATVCYFYGTPLMALFVAISLLSGGWLRRRKGRRRSGREAFGLLLGLAWACTGLYILSLIYWDDLRGN